MSWIVKTCRKEKGKGCNPGPCHVMSGGTEVTEILRLGNVLQCG